MQIVSKGTQDNPKFMVEDKVILHNFRVENDEECKETFVYSFDYDDRIITEEEAIKLSQEAVGEIVQGIETRLEENQEEIVKDSIE